jgi:DTW domain-containing protein YfiP
MQPAAKVIFLQHPREARNPIGTVRMAHLQLAGSQIIEGVQFASNEDAMALFQRERERSIVLYPTEGARDAETLREHQGPLTIWVLDGTWSQAKKLWRYNEWLHALPAYTLNPKEPGRYRIRREPAPHCLATIEAVSQLLDVVAGAPGMHARLLDPFDTMIERQLRFTHSGVGRVRRKIRNKKRTFSLPFDAARAVLVHAEGSGHVARSHGGTNELLEWHALRPSTGERFYAAVTTNEPVADRVRSALGLSDPQRARTEVEAAWAAFRAGDPCVGWGQYAPSLYGSLEHYFDLRELLSDYLKRRLGYVEDGTARLLLQASSDPRRGHRRISHLAAIFEHARQLASA